jgi:hypothetical protein
MIKNHAHQHNFQTPPFEIIDKEKYFIIQLSFTQGIEGR